jgi:hypothetical protein
MALTLAQDWTRKNGEVKAGLCGDPAMECLHYSQQLFLFNPQMVSEPRQKHCVVSTRCRRSIHMWTYNSCKRGFSDWHPKPPYRPSYGASSYYIKREEDPQLLFHPNRRGKPWKCLTKVVSTPLAKWSVW